MLKVLKAVGAAAVAILGAIGALLAVIPPARHVIIHTLSPDYMAALLILLATVAGILMVLLVRVGKASPDKPRSEGNVGFIDALTWSDAAYAISMLADRIHPGYRPDLVVGIDRGGAIVAGVLAKHLRVPASTMASSDKWMISSIEGSLDEGIKDPAAAQHKFQKILVVDDACRFGNTMRNAVAALKKLRGDCEIRTAVVLNLLAEAGPGGQNRLGKDKRNPDYYFYSTTRVNVFLPWDLQPPAEDRP